MSIPYFLPLVIVIFCNIGYHTFSKSLPSNINPFIGLAATYGVAFVGSLFLFLLTKDTLYFNQKVNIQTFYGMYRRILDATKNCMHSRTIRNCRQFLIEKGTIWRYFGKNTVMLLSFKKCYPNLEDVAAVPSRVMRKLVCRLWLNEVSQQ